jgi:hypothetical protein
MINEIRENKHLNKFKENSNKQHNEIRETIQDMKEEVKNIEILKKKKLKFWN